MLGDLEMRKVKCKTQLQTSAGMQADASRGWWCAGMRHPLSHLRGHAVELLRGAGVRVDVLGETQCQSSLEDEQNTLRLCLQANEVHAPPPLRGAMCAEMTRPLPTTF